MHKEVIENDYSKYNKINQKKETIMSNLIVEIKEDITLEEATYAAVLPGVNKEDLTVKCDIEENIIYVKVKKASKKNTVAISKAEKAPVEFSLQPSDKYDVSSAKIALSDGILSIIVKTNKDRIKTLEVE